MPSVAGFELSLLLFVKQLPGQVCEFLISITKINSADPGGEVCDKPGRSITSAFRCLLKTKLFEGLVSAFFCALFDLHSSGHKELNKISCIALMPDFCSQNVLS